MTIGEGVNAGVDTHDPDCREEMTPGLALPETAACRARSATARFGSNFPRHKHRCAPMMSKPLTMPCAEQTVTTP